MSVFIPEAVEAVTLRALLLALRDILAWCVAVALIAVAIALVETILWPLNKFVSTVTFGTVGSVPGSGAVVNFLTGQLKAAVKDLDHAVGTFWHALKRLAVEVGQEVAGLAILTGYIAWYLVHKLGVEALHAGQALLKRLLHSVTARVTHLEHRMGRVEHLVRSVGHGIYPRLRSLEHEVGKVLPREIKQTRELAKEAEAEAQAAWDAAKAIPWPDSATTWAEAVAVGLGSLGLDWLRCNSNPFKGNKKACGLWGELDDLLGLAVLTVGALEFETLVREAGNLTEAGIQDFRDVFGL